MKNLNLPSIGIKSWLELHHNLSYEDLFLHETDPALTGLEKGTVSEFGAIAVDTGQFTGRSPKDKYIVEEPSSREFLWWANGTKSGPDNQPISEEVWAHLKDLSLKQLNGKKLYVMDGFAGANPHTRLKVRLITEIAWMAHFFKNMFIRPTEEELRAFVPDWTILNACRATCADFKKYQLRSDVFVAFHLKERMTLIGGTWYAGEIKKGIFSIMNYFLPLQGIGSFHCSANLGAEGDVCLFFGLSGTGKTSLSTDPKRQLIGDDEHGWDEDGIFNFEGGCYAKCIHLTREKEPEIYQAIRRDALLENVEMDLAGRVDFASSRKTENSRVSYPIEHIENIVRPVSKAGPAKHIVFLTCDAYGVFPPVAKLSRTQAMYHYLSGYTAKVAGTELGVTEPAATFSACFGKAFLMLHPTRYADLLGEKIAKYNSEVYLINTGWVGGKYGEGKRIPLKDNRATVDAILGGTIDWDDCEFLPIFNLKIPRRLPGVAAEILHPRNSWKDPSAYDATLNKLARLFVENFQNFTDTAEGKALTTGGPQF